SFRKTQKLLLILSVFIGVNRWLVLPSVAWAQADALSAPTPVESQPKGVQVKPTPTRTATPEPMPADVVEQNGKTAPEVETPTPGITATPAETATSTPTFTFTPTKTPKPDKKAKRTPTPDRTKTPVPTPVLHLPQITTIPNPAYGDKVIFRVMTKGPAQARIVVYDRFFSKVKELSGEGDKLFDILWSLKKVSQGIYYYQAQVTDTATGAVQTIKMQSFAVMKDEANPNDGD
ncbi:MAG TPA: hypothetical protein VJ873_13135, partial [bacterium]|nr:hypothetical protein [bacterium]